MGCWSGQSPMPRTCPNFDPQPKKKNFFFLSSHFTAGLLARETAAAPDSVKKGWYRLKRENMKHKNYEKCVLHRAYAVATVTISNGSTVPLSTQYLQLYSIYSIYRCASVSTELNLFFKHRQLWKVVSTHSWMELYTVHTYIHTYIHTYWLNVNMTNQTGRMELARTLLRLVTFALLCFALLRLASLLCYSLPLQHLLYTYQGHDTPT